jgi:hypothetical protein
MAAVNRQREQRSNLSDIWDSTADERHVMVKWMLDMG